MRTRQSFGIFLTGVGERASQRSQHEQWHYSTVRLIFRVTHGAPHYEGRIQQGEEPRGIYEHLRDVAEQARV